MGQVKSMCRAPYYGHVILLFVQLFVMLTARIQYCPRLLLRRPLPRYWPYSYGSSCSILDLCMVLHKEDSGSTKYPHHLFLPRLPHVSGMDQLDLKLCRRPHCYFWIYNETTISSPLTYSTRLGQ